MAPVEQLLKPVAGREALKKELKGTDPCPLFLSQWVTRAAERVEGAEQRAEPRMQLLRVARLPRGPPQRPAPRVDRLARAPLLKGRELAVIPDHQGGPTQRERVEDL